MLFNRELIMVTDKELYKCNLCGNSTTNNPFQISNRLYCICNDCTVVIEHIVRDYTINLENRILKLENEKV